MENAGNTDECIATRRSRRVRHDKTGRLATLARLREAKQKGERITYEAKEDKVYDYVDESEYCDIVRKRQEDDWIVDDDGSGYVEDGREIFDEDVSKTGRRGRPERVEEKRKKNRNLGRIEREETSDGAKDIRSLFMNQPVSKPRAEKRPEGNGSTDKDEILGDILSEMSDSPVIKPASVSLSKRSIVSNSSPSTNKSTKSFSSASNEFNLFSTPPRNLRNSNSTNVDNISPRFETPTDRRARLRRELAALDVEETAKTADDKLENAENEPKRARYDEEMEDNLEPDEHFDSACSSQDSQKENKPVAKPKYVLAKDSFDPSVKEALKKQQEISENLQSSKDANTDAISLDGDSLSQFESQLAETESAPTFTSVSLDNSYLPTTADENGDPVFKFFWFDAHEDMIKQPGVVYLFGKTFVETANAFVSCCISVRNIEHRLYLLPRDHPVKLDRHGEIKSIDESCSVSMNDVYEEFRSIADLKGIKRFRCMPVSKHYAFDIPGIPAESEYLHVRYSADQRQVSADLKGSTFSHVFGTCAGSLEHFLLDRNIKGPCWLEVRNPQIGSAPFTWCKLEAVTNDMTDVRVMKDKPYSNPPPLSVLSVSFRTLLNSKTRQNEIVAGAILVQPALHLDKPAPMKRPFQQHFCFLTKPSDSIFPFDLKNRLPREGANLKIDLQASERSLLCCLLAKLQLYDPDIIVGHDIFGFDLDLLLQRIHVNKVPNWSRLGRLRRSVLPKTGGRNADRTTTSGRLTCDVKLFARELIRARSYDLSTLSEQLLREKRVEIDAEMLRSAYSSTNLLLQMVERTLMDSSFCLRIMYDLNILPLALQITNICGNVMSRTLLGGRSERNEFLLLHAFHQKDFIVPDKQFKTRNTRAAVDIDNEEELEDHQRQGESQHEGQESFGSQKKPQKKENTSRRKPAYAGGLVLEPKRGFYDKYILLLDFNSLYPSIFQEYNICYTTVDRSMAHTAEQDEVEFNWSDLELPDSDVPLGILPTEIRKLVQSRREVKKLMKAQNLSHELKMQYDNRQKALKLTANSMYGCLGFSHSRFYCKPLAALVTGMGREILMKTKTLVERANLEVIYGDTDSIMVNTNSTNIDEAFKLGNKIKVEVNKMYHQLEIDIDGVFKSMLLLKKKKYAALNVTKNPDGTYSSCQELKGLDIVRRDWSSIATEAGKYVVNQILSGEDRDTILDRIHAKLREVADSIKQGVVPVNMYCITKQLTKNAQDYPDKKSLPHVQVALRLNSKGGKQLKSGDTVYYIVCEDGTSNAPSQRGYHPDELQRDDKLTVDSHYYLAQQIHPVVSRLCEPIEGTDAAMIADCLGLDPRGYHHKGGHAVVDEKAAEDDLDIDERERYRLCKPFIFVCSSVECKTENSLSELFSIDESGELKFNLEKCSNPKCTLVPLKNIGHLAYQLLYAIRAEIKGHYSSWFQCDNPACGQRVKRLPAKQRYGIPVCPVCQLGGLHQESRDSQVYRQLCFYQFLFDVEKALKQLPQANRNAADAKSLSYSDQLKRLKEIAHRQLQYSAYSVVSLDRIFGSIPWSTVKNL